MKFYKKLFLDLYRFKSKIYTVAFLLIFIPMCIALVSDRPLNTNPIIRETIFCTSISLFIVGKSLTAFSRSKGDKAIYIDIGVIIGLLTALLSYMF